MQSCLFLPWSPARSYPESIDRYGEDITLDEETCEIIFSEVNKAIPEHLPADLAEEYEQSVEVSLMSALQTNCCNGPVLVELPHE